MKYPMIVARGYPNRALGGKRFGVPGWAARIWRYRTVYEPTMVLSVSP
jgi:hypothetical protein